MAKKKPEPLHVINPSLTERTLCGKRTSDVENAIELQDKDVAVALCEACDEIAKTRASAGPGSTALARTEGPRLDPIGGMVQAFVDMLGRGGGSGREMVPTQRSEGLERVGRREVSEAKSKILYLSKSAISKSKETFVHTAKVRIDLENAADIEAALELEAAGRGVVSQLEGGAWIITLTEKSGR